MSNMTADLAGEIRAEIARRKLSRAVLENAWAVNQSSVSAKLNGRSPLSAEEIDKAAQALGYDPFDFVARAGRNAANSSPKKTAQPTPKGSIPTRRKRASLNPTLTAPVEKVL